MPLPGKIKASLDEPQVNGVTMAGNKKAARNARTAHRLHQATKVLLAFPFLTPFFTAFMS
jgi:hypothetical protein